MNNPGKYDDACTEARKTTKAQGVLLIVIDGERGYGFSVQATADIIAMIPDMLEATAKMIRNGQMG